MLVVRLVIHESRKTRESCPGNLEIKKHRQTSEPFIGSLSSQKLTQLEDDDSWNIEWQQQGTLFDSVMYNALHFLERKMSSRS